jgi:type II secretory pathway component GspD/PulD (secretin)
VKTVLHTVNASEYIIKNSEAKRMREALASKPGVNLLSTPSVTTLVKRAARISVEETQFIVTDRTVVKDGIIVSGAADVTMGPSISVYSDSVTDTIHTKVSFTFIESFGQQGNGIRVRETESVLQIPHNHTQLIVIPPQPGSGLEKDLRQHIIFLTPTVIDATGMPVFK